MEKEVRLIDADKLKQHYAWWENGTAEMTLAEAKKNFDVIIDVQPTVDAEPVVRCKDCKHYNEYPSGFGCCEIHKGSTAIQTPLTFCAWGERKEDAETN